MSEGKTKKKTDAVGPSLLPLEKARSEERVQNSYMKRFAKVVLIQGPIVAYCIYYTSCKFVLSDESNELVELKLKFLQEYGLQYLYFAVYMIYLTRLPLVANVNGARAPTRLDRPNQHIYQVVGSNNLVLMANDGVNGRFNRAQRAISNMDEGMPLFLVNTLLVAPIFGEVVCFFLLPMYTFGRITFARDYKDSLNGRFSAFWYSMVAEHGLASFVPLIAIKVSFGV
jgi:hypothetical protein